jgi:hypothetical protein
VGDDEAVVWLDTLSSYRYPQPRHAVLFAHLGTLWPSEIEQLLPSTPRLASSQCGC